MGALRLLFCTAALLSPVAASSSALFTKGAGEVRADTATAVTGVVTQFTHALPNGEKLVLGTVTAGEGRTWVEWFPRPGSSSPSSAQLDLIGLERLYEHVLQQDPTRIYTFDAVREGKANRQADRTQGEVLRDIALARGRAAAVVARGGSLKPIPWSIASMEVIKAGKTKTKPDPDFISVRVVDGGKRPIAGATLTASRGADMMCSARSDARGVASCKLRDTHGHGEGTHDEDDGPTIVTFAGSVSAERIELPTTFRIPGPILR